MSLWERLRKGLAKGSSWLGQLGGLWGTARAGCDSLRVHQQRETPTAWNSPHKHWVPSIAWMSPHRSHWKPTVPGSHHCLEAHSSGYSGLGWQWLGSGLAPPVPTPVPGPGRRAVGGRGGWQGRLAGTQPCTRSSLVLPAQSAAVRTGRSSPCLLWCPRCQPCPERCGGAGDTSPPQGGGGPGALRSLRTQSCPQGCAVPRAEHPGRAWQGRAGCRICRVTVSVCPSLCTAPGPWQTRRERLAPPASQPGND